MNRRTNRYTIGNSILKVKSADLLNRTLYQLLQVVEELFVDLAYVSESGLIVIDCLCLFLFSFLNQIPGPLCPFSNSPNPWKIWSELRKIRTEIKAKHNQNYIKKVELKLFPHPVVVYG